MRGLIEKDLRLTLTRKQTILIFAVMAVFMSMSIEGTFIIGYLTMLAAIIAVGTISYDEFDNGFAFLMTLPFDRKTYVREKYLFSLMMAAAAWLIGTLLYFISSLIRRSPADPSELPMLLAFIPVLYMSVTVMIPLQLKYGSEKSRVVLFLIFGIIAVLVFGVSGITGGSSDAFTGPVQTLDRLSPAVVLLFLTAVCVLASVASYIASVRIMEKKEF